MIQRLPLELVYQVFMHVSYTEFPVLYNVWPTPLVDVALKLKLKHNAVFQEECLFKLVSTNTLEFVSASYQEKTELLVHHCRRLERHRQTLERSNESSLPLFYKHIDIDQRLVWLAPEFQSTQYYFEVLGFYVSHGQLVLRNLDQRLGKKEKVLGSLCDIRNHWMSLRGDIVPMTITKTAGLDGSTQSGTVILDAYCTVTLEQKQGGVGLDLSHQRFPPRPPLPWNYSDPLPIGYPTFRLLPTDYAINCGYFVVEQLAITIPEFLDLL